MPVFDFALRLNRAPTDDEIEVLYEVTGGDAEVEWNPGTDDGVVTINREADTLTDAIVSAVHDVEQVPGLRVVGATLGRPGALRCWAMAKAAKQ